MSQSIKHLRKQAGLTQQQLAEQTRCTRQDVSRVENGSFRGGFHKIERICERLGCAVTLRPQLEPGVAGSSEPIRILAIDDEPAVLWGYQQTFVPDQTTGINTLASLVQESDDKEQVIPLFSIATSTSGQEGVERLR